MKDQLHNRILAFAGMCQAAKLVSHLALRGEIIEHNSYNASIDSIFSLEKVDIPAIYGSVNNIQLGLKSITELDKKKNKQHTLQLTHYLVSMIILCRKLKKNQSMLSTIGERLKKLTRQTQHFTSTHDTIIANLADTYSDTLSGFKYRIQIHGKTQHLSSDYQLNKIRALLLAGIRSTILWYQLGGKAHHLIFARKQYMNAASDILTVINQSSI